MTAIWSRPLCVNTNIVGIKTYLRGDVCYVCLFVFDSVDKRVVQIKKYSGLKFVNMLGAGAMLQTPPFGYAVRSFQFHLIKINQNKGNVENLWWHMTQRVCFTLTWGLVHGPKYQIGHDASCLFYVYVFFFFSIALFVVGVICKLMDIITVILISYVFRPIHKFFKYV